jgi:hypothetical protein
MADVLSPSRSEAGAPQSDEDKQKQMEIEQDRELAIKMSTALQKSLDRLEPILKMITHVSWPPPLFWPRYLC